MIDYYIVIYKLYLNQLFHLILIDPQLSHLYYNLCITLYMIDNNNNYSRHLNIVLNNMLYCSI